MDDIIKRTSINLLESLQAALEKGNLDDASTFATTLTEISVTLDSKMGVFIGETIESSFIQLAGEVHSYEISNEEHSKEVQELNLRVNDLLDAIKSGEDSNIYSALLELRFHATKKQYSWSGKYKRRRPARFRWK